MSNDWSCTVLGYKNCSEPGAQFLDFADDNKRLGAEGRSRRCLSSTT